ncbi:MAG: class I SAM-dependent methyltransferase [archaeon]|jgi:hypothetical protein
MVRKTFKVVGHGDGALAKKAVDLAIRHPHAEVTAVDILPTRYAKYLKQLRLNGKPRNLRVVSRTDSGEYLEREKANSIHHQYTHFAPSSMKYYERQKFFAQLFRTTVPGGKVSLVETGGIGVILAKELKKVGFRVSLAYLSPEQVKKIGSPDAEEFTGHAKRLEKLAEGIDPKVIEDGLFEMKIKHEPRVTPEVISYVREATRRIARSKLGVNGYVRIIATKPKK